MYILIDVFLVCYSHSRRWQNGQRGLNGDIAALPAAVERELVHEPARIPSQKMAGKTAKDHLKIPESVGRTHVAMHTKERGETQGFTADFISNLTNFSGVRLTRVHI